MAPLLSEGFTETCPVYLNSYTVEHEPSLQVFGIGIPLLCLTVFFIFFFFLFLFRPHVMVCDMFVVIGMQLQLHKHHHRFMVPASWTPRGVTWLCWMLVSCC